MKKQTKKAWDLTEAEFNELSDRIPFKNKVGVYTSLTGKHTIEFKKDEPTGSQGTFNSHPTYEVVVDGIQVEIPFSTIRCLLFELPADFLEWVTYESVQEYKQLHDL